ncbi:uncharacterized protein A4U43_C03F7740 [Asparagus officinalis]|uniref:Uncharacterized protein n=1 Tax=Asparagus officinalis TaxID=4686 RepID=A0A5P1F8M7_ASPOF|nr:uncharacterized protein A4U43_C03F7340 [Asparagus officinalis]ONK74565.1 uncharacterized protein A4U43_C03F7740 [Asparagus officinalis]
MSTDANNSTGAHERIASTGIGFCAENRSATSFTPGLPRDYGLPTGELTTTATSAPHRVSRSAALLETPFRRFEKHTWPAPLSSLFFFLANMVCCVGESGCFVKGLNRSCV